MGLWDFSIGSILVLACLLSIGFSQMLGVVGLVVAPILCGAILGAANGLAYIKLRIPSLIVTVGLSLIYEAFSVFASAWAGTRLEMCIRDSHHCVQGRGRGLFRFGLRLGPRCV